MGKRKTNEEFTNQIFSLVEDEYEFLDKYIGDGIKIKCRHNECGNIWDVTPNSFLQGSRCPECAKVQIAKSNTKTNPEFISAIYDLVEDKYTFLEVYINNRTKIKCKHNECGYEWTITPDSFLRGSRCPNCSKKSAIKKTTKTNQKFVKEVYELIGDEYQFLEEYVNSKTKIMCSHIKCGYMWNVIPASFLRGTRCPQCYGNLRKTTETYKDELYSIVGDEYLLLNQYISSKTKIELLHTKCGYIWHVLPSDVLNGNRCPECKKKYLSKLYTKSHAQFVAEIYDLVGDEYKVLGKYINSKYNVLMRHNECGHEWESNTGNFLNLENRCPRCRNTSKGENKIREWLELNNISNISQHAFKNCKNIDVLFFDFYIPCYNLLVEYDGEQHYRPVNFGGISDESALENFRYTQHNDNIKTQYCKDNDIPLLRIPYWDFDNIEQILEEWVEEHGLINKQI